MMPKLNETIEWIDTKAYLDSPLMFTPIPAIISDFPGLPIEYLRRDLRMWWDYYAREKMENLALYCEEHVNFYSPMKIPFLKEYLDLFLDRDLTDYKNVKLHVK